MSSTVTVRLPDDVRARLLDAAKAMALPPATLAAKLIGDGLSRPLVIPDDGPLVVAVRDAFGGGVDPDPVRAAMALLLARQIEGGSSAGTDRLLALMSSRVEAVASSYESASDEYEAALNMPQHTVCDGCREPMTRPDGIRLSVGGVARTGREVGRLFAWRPGRIWQNWAGWVDPAEPVDVHGPKP